MPKKSRKKIEEISLKTLNRRKIRYYLFRLKNEADGGSTVDDCREIAGAILAHFESSQWFKTLGGIKQFSIKWDVSEHDPLAMIPREKSVLQEWQSELQEEAERYQSKISQLPTDDQPPE